LLNFHSRKLKFELCPKFNGQVISLLIIKFYFNDEKIIHYSGFAALTFTACNNSGKSSSDNSNTEQEQSAPVVNQDSIDKAHGHSHDPNGGHTAPAAKQDSSKVAPVNQDSIDKAHGHKH
jgi:hypothetical protein